MLSLSGEQSGLLQKAVHEELAMRHALGVGHDDSASGFFGGFF
jgi:hypothetical protein